MILNLEDLQCLADLIAACGLADPGEREAMLASIGVDRANITFLNTSPKAFSILLVEHLYKIDDRPALLRLCDLLISIFRGEKQARIHEIRAKIENKQSTGASTAPTSPTSERQVSLLSDPSFLKSELPHDQRSLADRAKELWVYGVIFATTIPDQITDEDVFKGVQIVNDAQARAVEENAEESICDELFEILLEINQFSKKIRLGKYNRTRSFYRTIRRSGSRLQKAAKRIDPGVNQG